MKNQFSRAVGAHEERKLKARRQSLKSIWFGLGMFGLVGWSVAVPTLLGAWLGAKLDQHYPGPHSYTLALLLIGLAVGLVNAWHWINAESQES